MFYAGYADSMLISDAGVKYNLPLAYLLAGCSYFICSLFLVVRRLVTQTFVIYLYTVRITHNPRGVLSDGDVRSPFLGLKFAIWGPFLGLKFCSDFFWVRDFGKDVFGGWQKGKPRGSRFYVKQLHRFHLLKKGGRKNYLEFSWIIIIIFLIGLFLGYVLGRWTFFGPGSSLKDFFGSKNFASFAHPRH